MTWNDAIAWWVLCGVLVAVELATGTFYLLMLALGAAAGALAAHGGLAAGPQMIVAAVIGAVAVGACRQWRARRPAGPPLAANPDLHLDVGQRVHVGHWSADGQARVHYRGSQWEARWTGQGSPHAGEHVIRALEGNRLLLDRG